MTSFLGNTSKKTGELFQKTVGKKNKIVELFIFKGFTVPPKNKKLGNAKFYYNKSIKFYVLERIKMISFIIGLFVGANLGLFLYACIIVGKEADKHIYKEGGKR